VGGFAVEEHTALATPQHSLPPEVVEKVVIGGDLSGLNAAQRADYYAAVCRGLGLNPLTKPFEYLNLHGQLRLYALRDCADQLRRLHGISIYITNREQMSDIYVVTARAKDRQGREDESTGAVTVGNLKGDALANALMKAETKAKRRVTLSIAGLGWLDETELETMPQHRPIEAAVTEGRDEAHPTAEQISALIELARSCGVDLMHFGQHMRQLINLPAETKITKKFLREAMILGQYEEAWQHYHELLKPQLVADGLDDPPQNGVTASDADAGLDSERHQTEPSSTSEASSEGPPAAAPQLARPEL
jgi:hypothetical protein